MNSLGHDIVSKAVKKSNDFERFAFAALDALSEHVAVLDEYGAIIAVNKAWREFAVSNSAVSERLTEGANYFAACASATGEDAIMAARFAAGLRAVINGELNEFSLEYPCHALTEQRWFIARATRFEFEGKGRAVVTHANITARKRIEERLKQGEEWLRAIFETSHDGMLVEEDERIIYVNNSYTRLLGYEKSAELIGRHISAVTSAKDAPRMLEYGLRRQRGESAPTTYEFKGKRRDGSLIDLEASVSTHVMEGKTYITTAIRDVSTRRQMEEALRRSERSYRLLIEQASDGIHTYDLQGNFIETNSKLCEMLGYTREEMLRLNVKDLVPAKDLAAEPIRFDELRAGQTLLAERCLRRKDGTIIPVEISGRMICEGVLQSIIRDISERKRAEAALREAYDEMERRVEERTAELAQANTTLKAEIAERRRAEEARKEMLRRLVTRQETERSRISRELHDRMGQHLTALMIGLKTLNADSHGRQSALDSLQHLQELTDEMARETHALAWALRPPTLDDLGLATAIYNYIEEWAEHARVPVDFHTVGLDGQRLPRDHETALYRIAQEALTNISKHSRAQRVSIILERRGNDALLVVEDDGSGFDVESLLRLPVAERRLGLMGMRERAELLGGTLNIESSPGAGASVFVRIPIGAAAEQEARPS